MNVTSVIMKQFKNKISTHINRVNMNESNMNVIIVTIKHLIKSTNQRCPTIGWDYV